MLTARRAAIRLLRLMMVASLVLPVVLFAFASWFSYRSIAVETDDRIDRSLDILHENALKVLQTIQVTFGEIDAITSNMSDEDIRHNEVPLHAKLLKIVNELPQLQGIAIIDHTGHLLVSANVVPVPRNLDLATRDYFRAQVKHDAGTYVSAIHMPRLPGIDTYFFAVSQRRPTVGGVFNGVISISVLPSYFEGFYARMARKHGTYLADVSYFGLVGADGGFLARYPLLNNRQVRLGPSTPLREGIARGVIRSIYTVKSQIDGVVRRIGYRKLTGFPLYVLAGVKRSAMVNEWLSSMSSHLIFGVPATAFLFAGLTLALRRTKRLYDEADRREAAEVAMRQAERLSALGKLTGGVAHDFNNLLMIISGSTQRLRGELSERKHMRLLNMISTATQRGEALTRQLLTYSRQQTLSPEVIDLTQRLRTIREVLARSLHANVEVKVEVPETPCAVRVDASEFELAILNLAVNAKDAMPQGGTLSIRAKPVTLRGEVSEEGLAGEFVAVRLADNGSGIAPHALARVFEPFFTTKEVGRGTGLGLSQVYGFAKQSGGTATITSAPGRGTTVTLYLPRSHEAAVAAAPARPVPAEAEPAGTVLLAEDNADVAEVAAGYLRQLGYRVRSVANAQAALAALRLDPEVDLVFSDILMPGGRSGVDLAREIAARFPDIPVLLTTGYSASAQEAVHLGLIVLQKPYDLEALRRHIHEAIESGRAQPRVASAE